MTSFEDAKGRKVVDLVSAETVGKVKDFVVDPATRSVVALILKKTKSGDTLTWADLAGFGPDAVTVQGVDTITEATGPVDALLGKDHQLMGKRVLSTDGVELGQVCDVEFDPDNGAVTSVLLEDGPPGSPRAVEGGRLVGVGSYAVVVQAE